MTVVKFSTYEEAIGRVRQLEDEKDTRFVIVGLKKRRPGELIIMLVSHRNRRTLDECRIQHHSVIQRSPIQFCVMADIASRMKTLYFWS